MSTSNSARRRPVAIPVRPAPGSDLPAEQREAVLAAIQEHRRLEGPLLPILHAVQQRLGWVPPQATALIAFELNLSRAEVHGVLTFYHYFRREPPGRHVIYLCRAEACQSVGARELEAHVQRKLGCAWHGASADGRYSLEPVYCLGNCATGPSVMIDRELHSRISPERFDALLGTLDAQDGASAEARR
jgi:formate dehydrogenase subunit gamma